jgi:hypothetical protein
MAFEKKNGILKKIQKKGNVHLLLDNRIGNVQRGLIIYPTVFFNESVVELLQMVAGVGVNNLCEFLQRLRRFEATRRDSPARTMSGFRRFPD